MSCHPVTFIDKIHIKSSGWNGAFIFTAQMQQLRENINHAFCNLLMIAFEATLHYTMQFIFELTVYIITRSFSFSIIFSYLYVCM